MEKIELRYIIIKVKNLERAKKFYIELIGNNPSKEEPNRIVQFDLGNIKIGLYNPLSDGLSTEEFKINNSCIPSFGVINFKSELKRITDFAKIIDHRKVGRHEWFEFEDSEGNILEIHKK